MLFSRSTGLIDVAPGVKAEAGTVVFEGREFTEGGAYLSEDYAIGYLRADPEGNLHIATWEGRPMGDAVAISSWRTPRSYVSSRMFQVEALIDGRRYTGRTAGCETIWRGRRKRGRVRSVDSQLAYIRSYTMKLHLGLLPRKATVAI